jgi:hypothetical protein
MTTRPSTAHHRQPLIACYRGETVDSFPRRCIHAAIMVGFMIGNRVDAQASDTCVEPGAWTDSAIAATLAPVLHFAPGEHYFPTIPLFGALAFASTDTADPAWSQASPLLEAVRRDDEARIDELGDLFQATGGSVAYQTRKLGGIDSLLSLRILDSVYRGRGGLKATGVRHASPAAASVFYRAARVVKGCRLRTFWRFLENDPLAWKRMWRQSSLDPDTLAQLPLRVVEYYFYYLRDQGLVGHPDDREMVYIFVPDIPSQFCSFRVIVGSGHSDRTPNNIMVADNATIRGRPQVLVELGGHSSSPDLPPYGRFQPGIDVNWNLHHAWGTRDVQALSGFGWSGRYSLDMTIRRDTISAVILRPDSTAPDNNIFHYALIPVEALESLSVAVRGLCAFSSSSTMDTDRSTVPLPEDCQHPRDRVRQATNHLAALIGLPPHRRTASAIGRATPRDRWRLGLGASR